MELDQQELERRYLALSRQHHPDHLVSRGDLDAQGSEQEQLDVLLRSAAVNDAYRTLRDPWRRAEALLELREPGVLQRTKQLPTAFLAAAMELAEETAGARGEAAAALRARLVADVEQRLRTVSTRIAAGDFRGAATALHAARYCRKALHDLEGRG
jgi:molecular chaperone HscB